MLVDPIKHSFLTVIARMVILIKKGKKNPGTLSGVQRAIDGARTRGLHLGKVALYQLSYYRVYVAITTVTTN